MDTETAPGHAWRPAQPRSPPGTWRLLAPATLVWGLAVWAVAYSGSGWIVMACAAIGGLIMLLASLVHSWVRGVIRHGLLTCALVLLLGSSLVLGDAERAAPPLLAAAQSGDELSVAAVLRGFPEGGADGGGWCAAEVEVAGKHTPVVLWFGGGDGGSASASDETSGSGAGGTGGAGDSGQPGTHWGPGTRVSLRATVVEVPPGSAAAYGLRVAHIEEVSARGWFARAEAASAHVAASLRVQLRGHAARVPGAELVPGFAVGETSLISEPLDARMKESSLSHLVAVSGANCALILAALGWIAGLLGLGKRSRIVCGAVGLAAFVVVVGPDASVQRAAIMAVVLLVSGFGGHRAVSLPSLGIAMLVMLLTDPWQSRQPGFALSVAATAAILLLAPALLSALRRFTRLPAWALLPVAVAFAAQLGCGPLLLLLQPELPAAGVLANVLAAPAAPIGTGVGLLAMLALTCSEPVGHLLVWVAALPSRWVIATADVTVTLPWARWSWPAGIFGAVLLAAVEAMLLLAWGVGSRRLRVGRPAARLPWRQRPKLPIVARTLAAGLACAALGAFAGPTVVSPLMQRAATPDGWFMVACDVGQGDAVLLRDPARPEQVMLVDTGDDPEKLRACLSRFGVSAITLLVLTHDDQDHVGALSSIIDRVDAAIVAPDNRADGAQRRVIAQLEKARVPVARGAAGQQGSLAPPSTSTSGDVSDGLEWLVLAPGPGTVPSDTNAASVVMRVRVAGLSVLLLADTGADEQARLRFAADTTPDATLAADVVKIAHHGSRDHDAALPGLIGAEVGLISVGAENSYGHPTPEAIADYEAAGTRVLRTDRQGSLALIAREPAPGGESTPAGEAEKTLVEVWTERAPE